MFVPGSEDFVRVFPDFFTETSVVLRSLADNAVTFLRGRRIKYRHPRADDPGFLRRDLLQCIPEVLHMVISNGCDHAHFRRFHRAGRIQAAAQSGLQYGVVHICIPESAQRHPQQEFKKRGVQKPGCFHPADRIQRGFK